MLTVTECEGVLGCGGDDECVVDAIERMELDLQREMRSAARVATPPKVALAAGAAAANNAPASRTRPAAAKKAKAPRTKLAKRAKETAGRARVDSPEGAKVDPLKMPSNEMGDPNARRSPSADAPRSRTNARAQGAKRARLSSWFGRRKRLGSPGAASL